MTTREQFLLDRKQGIGGSDVAAIMGISPWKTPLDVYNDKLSADIEDNLNDDLARGIRAEKYVLETYAETTGATLKVGVPTIVDKDYSFMRANIDAMIEGESAIVEAKTTKASKSAWDSELPEYYKAQVAYYAMIADVDRVDIAVLFSGWEFECFTYWRDEEYEAKIKTAVIDFWENHVVKMIPPKPYSSSELMAMYPTLDEKKTIDADDNVIEMVSELQEVTEERKNLETREKELKQSVQRYMEDASYLNAGFCKVALKERKTNRFNTTAFKVDNPEMYQNYVNETCSRVLQFMRG